MNKILILIGAVLLLTGVFSCSEESLKSEEGLLPLDPDAGEGKLPNDMWAWVVAYPGEVVSARERLDDVSVLVKGGYDLKSSLNVSSKPKYWQSSGLYVPPAEEIEITIPEGINNLYYHIGVASIKIPENTVGLKRFNSVADSGRLNPNFNVVDNNFGGHLYFYYEGIPNASDITVTVNGAVKSPDFIAGQSNFKDWTVEIEDTLSPMIWGEMIGKNIAITLPIKELRKIEDPEALLAEYDGLVKKLGVLWGSNFDTVVGIPLWRIYADVHLPGDAVTFSGYPTGLNMDKEDILKELRNIRGFNSAKSKLLINALGKSNITPWYTSDILSALVPQLSTYYLYNSYDRWPLDVENLTERPPVNRKAFSKLEEKFRIRMLIQLAQEYGWGLYTYVNTALSDKFSTSLNYSEDKQEIHQQIKNDLFAISVSEYANENLTEYFNGWNFPLTSYAKQYMTQFNSLTDSIWKDFDNDRPNIDEMSPGYPKPGLSDPMEITDTIYNTTEWTGYASSQFSEERSAANLLDGNVGTIWYSNWATGPKQFPYDIRFNFDKEADDHKHELEFNYVIITQTSDAVGDRIQAFRILYLGSDTEWKEIEDARVLYLANESGEQKFYLNDTFITKGVKIEMINNHHHKHDQIGGPGDGRLAEFRIGLIK